MYFLFLYIDLIFNTFAEFLYSLQNFFLVDFLGYPIYAIMPAANRDNFISSFSIFIYFPFSYLIFLPSVFIRSGECGHPFLISDFSKTLASIFLVLCLRQMYFCHVNKYSSIPIQRLIIFRLTMTYFIPCCLIGLLKEFLVIDRCQHSWNKPCLHICFFFIFMF